MRWSRASERCHCRRTRHASTIASALGSSHHSPTGFLQTYSGLCVSASVRLDLRSPVVNVRLGRDEVGGAPVPEAPGHKNRDPHLREVDVGSSSPIFTRRKVRAVAQAMRVEYSSDPQFGPRVSPPVRPHSATSHPRRCPRSHSRTERGRVSSSRRRGRRAPQDALHRYRTHSRVQSFAIVASRMCG